MGEKNIVNLPRRLQKLYGSIKNVFSFLSTRARRKERRKLKFTLHFRYLTSRAFPNISTIWNKKNRNMKTIFFLASEQKIETSAKLKHFYWNVRFRLFFVVSETASRGRKPYDNNVKWRLQKINSRAFTFYHIRHVISTLSAAKWTMKRW